MADAIKRAMMHSNKSKVARISALCLLIQPRSASDIQSKKRALPNNESSKRQNTGHQRSSDEAISPEQIIEQLREIIAQRDRAIKEKDRTIEGKNNTLAERNRSVQTKDQIVTQLLKKLAQRDWTIDEIQRTRNSSERCCECCLRSNLKRVAR